MKNIDIQINEDYSLKTDPARHDLAVGEVTFQNQALILIAQPGEWKEHPMTGCGIEGITNDDDTGRWLRDIREQLTRDGLTVRTLKINQDDIEIDAEYEND